MLSVLVMGGLRISELLALQWGNVQLAEKRLAVVDPISFAPISAIPLAVTSRWLAAIVPEYWPR